MTKTPRRRVRPDATPQPPPTPLVTLNEADIDAVITVQVVVAHGRGYASNHIMLRNGHRERATTLAHLARDVGDSLHPLMDAVSRGLGIDVVLLGPTDAVAIKQPAPSIAASRPGSA